MYITYIIKNWMLKINYNPYLYHSNSEQVSTLNKIVRFDAQSKLSIIWTVSSENAPSSMRKKCGFASACAPARSHPGICSPLIHSIVSSDSDSGQRRPRSDCADAQSDQDLRSPRIPEGAFSLGITHVVL